MIQELIQEAKRQGFTTYTPEALSTYFYFTDGERIGYAQADRLKGPSFFTVHKPCKHAGTGYKADTMAEALSHRPSWAMNDAPVIKYRDPAEFIAKHWQPLKQI
jgi:hypothetical protein